MVADRVAVGSEADYTVVRDPSQTSQENSSSRAAPFVGVCHGHDCRRWDEPCRLLLFGRACPVPVRSRLARVTGQTVRVANRPSRLVELYWTYPSFAMISAALLASTSA